jgi:predicted nucleic acid-binding Zn ribbon protein
MPREPDLAVAPVQTSAVQSSEMCPSCGAAMATDQRYCLECGQRRGDPRLPFMDAVVLMDAVKRPPQAPPPPPKKKRSSVSPNAALIAGVGTLLLALGIGVLIGRSGHQEVAQTSAPAQVITVGGSGDAGGATASKGKAITGGKAANAKTKKQKAAALKEAEAHPAAEEVLKPAGDVKLAPPTVKPGDKCEPGAAGCEGGEFTGDFFGE